MSCDCSYIPCPHGPVRLSGTVTVKKAGGQTVGAATLPDQPAPFETHLTYEVVKVEKGALLGHAYYDVTLVDTEPSQMERATYELMPSSGQIVLRLPAAASCADFPVGRRFDVTLRPQGGRLS